MSDTCYCSLRCRQADQEKFEELGFNPAWRSKDSPPLEASTWVDMEDEQCNYAAHDELEALAKEGIPFYGSHGAGDDYPEGCFAAADGAIAWPDCLYGMPAVRVTNGPDWFDAADVELVEKYDRLLKRAKKLLGEGDEDTHPH